MIELIGVRLLVSRTPTSLPHRNVPLLDEPAKRESIVGEERWFDPSAFRFTQNDLSQHLLGFPLGSFGLFADGHVTMLPDLLSFLILPVHQELPVPHLHLLATQVDGALLILHCHTVLRFLLLVLVVENNSFIHQGGADEKRG